MKTTLRNVAIVLLAIVTGLGYFYFNNSDKGKELSVAEQRQKHEEFLKNSPFKKTLSLSKAERKAQGLPPNKFYEREWELTMNPSTGYPEPGKVLAYQKKRNGLVGKMPGDGTAGNDWESRGPNNVGGRTRVVLFDPNDATNKTVYAGGVSGGLWVNNDITDINSAWTLVSGVPSNMNISCITVDPNDSDVWYIGTGEQYTFGAAVGNGVYKTTDGGANWTNITVQLAGGASFDYNSSNSFLAGIYYINDIIAWDNGGNTEVFIGVGAHAYGDSSSPSNWLGLQSAGLYRSTDDGVNWARIESSNLDFLFSGSTYYFIPNDFEISANNTLWMGMIETPAIGGGGGGRVFSSTNGATWTEAGVSPLANSNRTELAVSSTNANLIYALTQGTISTGFNAGPHIYVTTDGFATNGNLDELAKPNDVDSDIPANDFTRGQAFYDLVIEVDPSNDQIFYVGGIDLFRSEEGTSTNSVFDWTQISQWYDNGTTPPPSIPYVHADQHAFTFVPGDSNKAVIGCDGGVFYMSNLSTPNFSNVGEHNKDYVTTQFYFGGYGQDTGNELILAGAQDNGSQFINGAAAGLNSSARVYGGDGAYSTVDKDGNYMVVSYVYANHVYLNLPYNDTGYTIDNSSSEGDFINPGGLDHNLNILFVNGSSGSGVINRYVLGATSSVKEQLTNGLLDSSPTAFKVSPYSTSSTTLLVGTANGKLLKLSNANDSAINIYWEEITGPSFVGSVSAIEFGATENDIFVTFHNYGVTSVWFTSDGGATWLNKEGNLPDMPVKSILQNPLARNEVMLGTELGIWTSKNFNEDTPTWTSSFNGMRDVKVVDLDLRTDDNTIMATTFGRGTFTGAFAADTDATFTISTENSVVNECKPDDAIFTFDFTALGGYNTATTLSVSGLPAGASSSFSQSSISSSGTFTLTISDLSGVTVGEYTLTVTGTGGGKTINSNVLLKVNESTLGATNITSPIDELTGVALGGTNYSWDTVLGATSYEFELATDAGFTSIVENGTAFNNSYVASTLLTSGTVYYWRVKAVNSCVEGDFSETFVFRTSSNTCSNESNNIPVSIPDGAGANSPGSTVTSTINIPSSFSVSDVNVTLDISHTYIEDLVISLTSPAGTEIVLFDRNCAGEDGLSIVFDDDVVDAIVCGTEPVTGTAQPSNALSGFNGEDAQGNWLLSVTDYYNGDDGTINSWSVEICESAAVTNSNLTNVPITVGTNSTHVFQASSIEASNDGTLATDHVFMVSEAPTVGELRLNNVALSLGETFTQDDINNGVVSYVNTSSVSASDSFKVDITNATGGFLPNVEVAITIDAALSVSDDALFSMGVAIYPTISDGNLTISSSKYIGETNVEVYALNGQRVYANKLRFNSGDVQRIHINGLAAGMYILKLNAEEIQGSKKIVIK